MRRLRPSVLVVPALAFQIGRQVAEREGHLRLLGTVPLLLQFQRTTRKLLASLVLLAGVRHGNRDLVRVAFRPPWGRPPDQAARFLRSQMRSI